ncbi:uncharacterized protein LOC114762972 [Neltuma alba]|uniref:uncharacterized protein LOC114762972 n=1 Tax=Neltuma alba TaxID=207710 RepID=UPI0010A40306|nr:uncharacterized protein LOC114762972 [Prosopis alba]
MEQSLSVKLVEKGERTPITEENRTSKKVKTTGEMNEGSDMIVDENGESTSKDGGWSTVQKELFQEPEPENVNHCDMEADPHHDVESMKQPQESFKEKLLKSQASKVKTAVTPSNEVMIEEGDVSVVMDGLIPSITFSQRIKDLLIQCMKLAVVIKVLGRSVHQDILQSKIITLWNPQGDFKLTELEGNCYMVNFENEADYQVTLLGGPWVIQGHYLTVHPWEPTLSPRNLEIKQEFGWVRLPGLPYHYYHKHMLRAIGEVIGRVLRIDYNTEDVAKARFARLAVKIDLTKPLVSKIKLDGITQYVEYEGLPTICYHCGRYGHLDIACPLKERASSNVNEGTSSPEERSATKTDDHPTNATWMRETQSREDKLFGKWMKVPSRGRRPAKSSQRGTEGSTAANVRGGNRFDLLNTHDDRDQERGEDPKGKASEGVVAYPSDQKKEAVVKSMTSRNKKTEKKMSSKKTVNQGHVRDSIFESRAYQEARIPTTINEGNHSAVVLNEPRMPLQPNEEMSKSNAKSMTPRPRTTSTAGEENSLPRPPEGSSSKLGFKLQPNIKIKNLKPKAKDDIGSPSEELTKALAEALGATIPSDEDMSFMEAAETGFEDDSASERSDQER